MKVRLTDFRDEWFKMFQTEAQFLKKIFGCEVIRFEQFGSTSVQGMKAKPVIDMMCIVKCPQPPSMAVISPVAVTWQPNNSHPQRHWHLVKST